MKGRDLAILAAVLLVAGVAVADSLRQQAGPATETATEIDTETDQATDETGPEPQGEAPSGWHADLQGTLVFTDSRDCRVRVIGLARGRERPLRRFAGTCRMWAAPAGQRLAYGEGAPFADPVDFRIVNLNDPNRVFDSVPARAGTVLWSPDGQRAAWCESRRTGVEYDVGGEQRLLPFCPGAYTTSGTLAHVRGRRLLVGDRTVLRASGKITYTHWGADGSVAIVVAGRRLERWERRRLAGAFDLPAHLRGALPILSPDNCAALLASEPRGLELHDLGCFRGDVPLPYIFLGTTAAWSPDGEWIAVAEGRNSVETSFVRVVGGEDVLRWPAGAVELLWRGR